MKKVLLLSIFTTLFGQIQYSGYINTEAKIRNNTGKILDLPYRLSHFNFSYTFAMLDIISAGDIEFRNQTKKGAISLRELYMGFYPSFGEIRFGKQINSWGLADGNNPTDNLNPYDLNYMFLTGTDRKIPSISFTLDTYINDYKLGLVLIPNHEPTRSPIEDSDLKLGDNTSPPSIENEDELQWGISLQSMIADSDMMLTYFNGYDFSPSYAGNYNQFEYRKTQVYGVSTVSFWSDMTFRTELAYFDTKTALNLIESANYKAEYLQYVFQLEYTTLSDITFTSQILGNKMVLINGDNFDDKRIPSVVTANSENFNMGLGTPFAAFSKNVLLLSSQKEYLNGTFDISLTGMIDLTQSGFMLGANIEYSPFENLILSIGTSKFMGKGSIFELLEKFSNTSIAVKYSF